MSIFQKIIKVYFLIAVYCFISCKKNEIVNPEQQTVWSEVKYFYGNQRYFLSSGSNNRSIFLQQPFYFSQVRQPLSQEGITIYGANLPTDVNIRIPISKSFFALPFSDIGIDIRNNENPTRSRVYNLKNIDTNLVKIRTAFLANAKCMVINNDETLIVNYINNKNDNTNSFFLIKVNATNIFPFVDTVYSKTISIKRTNLNSGVRLMTSIEDVFYVEIFPDGIFKIASDGQVKKVYNGATYVDVIYKWKNKIYAHQEWGKMLVSNDDGNNWQPFNGIPDFFTQSKFYKIQDSLIGVYNDQLFTLDWNNNEFKTRTLNNVGLERTSINGLQILNDTVYAVTTSGLYIKPVTSFFKN